MNMQLTAKPLSSVSDEPSEATYCLVHAAEATVGKDRLRSCSSSESHRGTGASVCSKGRIMASKLGSAAATGVLIREKERTGFRLSMVHWHFDSGDAER